MPTLGLKVGERSFPSVSRCIPPSCTALSHHPLLLLLKGPVQTRRSRCRKRSQRSLMTGHIRQRTPEAWTTQAQETLNGSQGNLLTRSTRSLLPSYPDRIRSSSTPRSHFSKMNYTIMAHRISLCESCVRSRKHFFPLVTERVPSV
jgi:hypothetical protein